MLKTLFLLLCCAGVALLPPKRANARGPIASSPCISTGWPHDQSDLPVDKSLIFGTLDNGLRYVLKHNGEPKNRVALYLNVQAGSLHESAEQRGLAHYLEHMLFNGSTHYPPGTLVQYFQSIGMGFGADTNAHTSYDETVYKLVLPAADEKTLNDGLVVLTDYARGALLSEEEVERERGVIFAEKRSRNSARSRVGKAQIAFDFAGTLLAGRDPIGTDETLSKANSRRLRAFYDAWYRPENLVVVMVGDMDVQLAEKLVRQHFAPLKAEESVSPVCPDQGAPLSDALRVLHVAEPELGYTELGLATVHMETPGPDMLSRKTTELHRFLAMSLLNNRLEQLEREPGSPLSESGVYSGEIVRQFRYTLLGSRTEAENWEKGLRLLHMTLEQALRHGFTEAELERGKKELLATLEKAAQTEGARDSRELAMTIIRNLNEGKVTMSPSSEKALYTPILAATTLETVNRALRDLWPVLPRSVMVAGTALSDIPHEEADARILHAYASTLATEPPPWKARETVAFPYLTPEKHEPCAVERRENAAAGVQILDFAGNSLTAHLKKTDFQPNQILMSVHFGTGLMEEPLPGAALLAQGVVRQSGTGTMDRDQLQSALAGSNARITFTVGPESFSFTGKALSSELELLMQLLYTCLHDPGFRPEAFEQVKDQLRQRYLQMSSSVEGMQQLEGERFLSGGSLFYSTPSWQEVDAVTLNQIEAWLRPVLRDAPLEINLVGDIDLEETQRLLERYFGGEQRKSIASPSPKPVSFPRGETLRLSAPDSSGKAMLTLAWKTDDFWDINRTRGLNMLAHVLDDRVRIKIREDLGAAYSPQVYSRPSRIDPDFGLLETYLVVAPDQADFLAGAVRDVAKQLVSEGINTEEFKRAQEPTLTAIREQLRSNVYWLNMVLSLSSRHKEQLSWPESILKDFTAMRPEEIHELARHYLTPDGAAAVLVLPKRP